MVVLSVLLLPLALHVPTVAAAAPDFSLTAYWTYATGTAAQQDTIILTSLNGYIGTLTLGLMDPMGFYSQLQQTSVALNSTNPVVRLYLLASETTPGNYIVNVTATDGTLTHLLSIKYNVVQSTAPNYSIYSNEGLSSGWRVLRGTSSGSSIVITSTNGFAGTVSLQAASYPSGPVLSFESSNVNVQPGPQPGTTNIALSVPMTAPVGSYTIVLNGTSGSITQIVYLDVFVTYGFSLTANPTTATVPQGGQTVATVTLSSLGGWTGTTGLSASCPGLTCNFNPTSLQLTNPASTAQSMLTISIGLTTLPGTYTVYVSENSPSPAPTELQRTSITITVTGPDFTVSASPNALTFAPGVAASLQTTVTLTSLDGFSGAINTTIFISPSVGPPLPDPPTASPTSKNLTQVAPSGPYSFTVTISVDSMVMQGPYIVQITAVTRMQGGLLSHTFYAVATVGPDFQMSASSANLVVHQGTLAISTITFTSLNGFAGGMMMEAGPISVQPPNPRTDFFPSYPTISSGGTNSTEFVVIADQYTGLGTYNIWVSASTSVQVGFGWISHAIPMTLTIEGPVTGPDFALTAQPSHVNLSIGSTTTSTISIDSINGFSGTLTLQAEGYGLLRSLSPATVTIGPAYSASSTLTVTAPTPYQIDGYPLWYTASGQTSFLVIASDSTGFSHWVWVNETISPVKVVENPTQFNIPMGSSATSQIVVSSLSGFNLTVAVSASISPSGPTISLTNNFINFSASIAPVTLTLIINVSSTVAPGNYVVLVTATAMSHRWFCQCDYYNITNTTPVDVYAVGPSPPPSGPGPSPSPQPNGSAGILGIPPTEFYGIVGSLGIILVVSVGYLGFRSRKRPMM
jgi:hypothetical protein